MGEEDSKQDRGGKREGGEWKGKGRIGERYAR